MMCVKYILAIILIIMLIILPAPALAIDNGYARIVFNVRGLQDYDLHWNDRFPPGSILKIYAEANGVNHRREVAVDYVFIIKDSNNNIVETAAYSNRYDDYRENDFLVYSREVPSSWEDGVYTAEIHIYDLLNDTLMEDYYLNVTQAYLRGDNKPDLPIMERKDVFNMSADMIQEQLLNLTKTFYIDRYASKYPVDRFRVEGLMLDRTSVSPKEPVAVSVNVTNTFYDKGSTDISLLMDNKLINNATVEIEPFYYHTVVFTVSSDIAGNHSIEIVPTGQNTIGTGLSAVFNVSATKEIELPTTFSFEDIQIDNMSVYPNKSVTISVTVENKGKAGSMPVELFINDVLEQVRQVYLNFSEIQEIKFNVTKEDLGAYRVTIGNSNLSKVFFVETPTQTPSVTGVAEKERKPQLTIILGLSMLVVVIFALRLYLKRKLK